MFMQRKIMKVDNDLKSKLESASCDKTNWFQTHSLSEDERKKLIDEKIKRFINQIEFNRKALANL